MAGLEIGHLALSGDGIDRGHQPVSGGAHPAWLGVQRARSDHRAVVVPTLGRACILAGRALGAWVDG